MRPLLRLAGLTLLSALPVLGIAQTAPLDTTTSLTAIGPQTGPQGTVFTLQAAVTDTHGPVGYGSVTFFNGDPAAPTAALGTVVINQATGIATLKTGSFTKGSHAISARFNGTNSDAQSTSATVELTVTAGKYPSTTTLHVVGTKENPQLLAQVSGLAPQPLDGTVTFTDTTTNTVLATVPLNTPLLRASFGTPVNEGEGFEPVLADFNNDGNLDLLVIVNAGISVALGRGDGTFQSPVVTSVSSPAQVEAADLNNDGILDLAGLCFDQKVCAWFGKGDGTFHGPHEYPINFLPRFTSVGDFNNDGKLDIIASWYDGSSNNVGGVSLYINHGLGNFEKFDVYQQSGTSIGAIQAADFNGDGKADFMLAISFGVLLFLGHGNGTFAGPTELSLFSPFVGIPVVPGDYNSDGKIDIAGNSGNIFNINLGHGNGTYTTSYTYNPGPFTGYAAGDFNADGKLDVFLVNFAQANVLLGHGSGTFLPEDVFTLPAPFENEVAGDLNNDGVPDLAFDVKSSNNGGYVILTQPLAIAAAGYTGVLPSPTDMITATFNGNDNFSTSTSIAVLATIQQQTEQK